MRALVVSLWTLILSGCYVSYPDRYINLANEHELEPSGKSFLLVDKTDDSSNGTLIVTEIDAVRLDVVMDPCVYILDPGRHVVKFEYYDSARNSESTKHEVASVFASGKYYQVIPDATRDSETFSLALVSPNKFQEIREKNKISVIRYLFFFKG